MQPETRIERAPDHPNVLLAWGVDLFPNAGDDANSALLKALREAVAPGGSPPRDSLVSPVRPGTHDFWVIYSVGATGPQMPAFRIPMPGPVRCAEAWWPRLRRPTRTTER